MTCIHTVSSTGEFDVTLSVGEENVLYLVETFLAVLDHFGKGGRVEVYDQRGNLINYLEV